MGSPTDPMVMNPPTSADWLAQQAADSAGDDSMVSQLVRLALAFFLDGMEPHHFTEAQLDRFAAGGVELRAPLTSTSVGTNLLSNCASRLGAVGAIRHRAELGAMASLVVYTVVRFAAAGGTLGTYGVDARWFLFWDVVNGAAYVWSIGRLVRSLSDEGRPFGRRWGGRLLALVSFMAPYAYLYYAGAGEFPPLAWILLSLLVVLFAANAIRSVRSKVNARRLVQLSSRVSQDVASCTAAPLTSWPSMASTATSRSSTMHGLANR